MMNIPTSYKQILRFIQSQPPTISCSILLIMRAAPAFLYLLEVVSAIIRCFLKQTMVVKCPSKSVIITMGRSVEHPQRSSFHYSSVRCFTPLNLVTKNVWPLKGYSTLILSASSCLMSPIKSGWSQPTCRKKNTALFTNPGLNSPRQSSISQLATQSLKQLPYYFLLNLFLSAQCFLLSWSQIIQCSTNGMTELRLTAATIYRAELHWLVQSREAMAMTVYPQIDLGVWYFSMTSSKKQENWSKTVTVEY